MNYLNLGESIEIKKISESEKKGEFSISGLYPGYGLTIGNSLRRILLSSLPGSAITYVKIKGVNHEFSTIDGVVEDVIELTLNLKKLKFKMYTDEPQVLELKIKGEKEVTGKDIKLNSDIEIANPDEHIATLSSKGAELDMELTVEKGLGYSPADMRKDEKLSVGNIAIDAFFSPVIKVNYTIDNIRVGDRTDFNKINLEIFTDGTILPSAALFESAEILKNHFSSISSFFKGEETETEKELEESDKKETKKKKSKK
ncbi:MAG: DNA-directed RNA polymerase subunit alpha [Candidatus Pacebacteria bacterium]|nr:DNA-directed RNA polymerase subunit alpha [Candidatus Paceibacterota bacterium]